MVGVVVLKKLYFARQIIAQLPAGCVAPLSGTFLAEPRVRPTRCERDDQGPWREPMVKRTAAPIVLCLSLVIQSAAGQTVLLDFSSPHCEPCQHMLPIVDQLAAKGYPIRKVDITRDQALAQRFNIYRVPCFVMVADGKEVDRLQGMTSQATLEQLLIRGGASTTPPIARTQSPDPEINKNPWASTSQASSTYASASVEQSPEADARKRLRDFPPLGQQAPDNTPGPPAWGNLLGSTVRIRVDDGGGVNSRGTGTIIDARSGEALIITCGHLFRDSKGQGPVSVELFEHSANGPKVVAEVSAQVIGYDLDRDIGLISIRPARPVGTAMVSASPESIERGHRVASMGCDNGDVPTILSTRITAIDRYQGPPNIEASGAPVEGRSGGGLFNERGELIGVCFAADTEGNEGLYVGLPAIHEVLDSMKLGDLYRAPSDTPAADALALGERDRVRESEPVVRGQDPTHGMEPVTFAQETATTSLDASATPPSLEGRGRGRVTDPQSLSPSEQAAMEELMRRAAESEVVCIIRPKDPTGKSEIITLESVSPEFIRDLVAARRTKNP
jgi:thiol-disulfide isomerase/thioredoxin